MGAIPYSDTPVQDGAWDGAANERAIPNDAGAATLRKMYAWVDSSANPDSKSSYKLPHHFVSNGSPGAASASGVRAALSRLGQSATQIPAGDVGAVRSHLQRHLDKFNSRKSESPPSDLLALAVAGEVVMTEDRVWAVRDRSVMAQLLDYHGKHLTVDDLGLESLERLAAQGSRTAGGGVAVIGLQGLITPKPSLLSMLFGGGGGLSTFMGEFRQAIADPEINSVVLDVNSPGGMVDMVPEAAAEIRAARDTKPIVAVANTLAASAAYWLASQAHEMVVTPSGEAGSIGVYQLHRDMSAAMEQAGIKPTLISAGKYKVEGNPFEPLDGEARDSAQQAVDDYYSMFVKDVAKGRGVAPSDVRDGYGQGRSLLADRAHAAGLVDRVATLGETVQRMGSGRSKLKRAAEDGNGPTYTAEDKRRVIDMMLPSPAVPSTERGEAA